MKMFYRIEFLVKKYFKIPSFRVFCFVGRLLSPFTLKRLQKEKISKILVFQGGGIGDMIRIFPFLRPLHEQFPHSSITVLSPFECTFFNLYKHANLISEFIVMDMSGKHKSFFSKLSLLRSLRKKSFDLIVCPQVGLGMIEFAIMSLLTGAPYRIGYDMNGSGFLYTSRIALRPNVSIYEQHGELLKAAGIRSFSYDHSTQFSYLRISEDDMSFARSFMNAHDIAEEDIVFTISPVVLADTDNKSPQHIRPLSELRVWPERKYVELISKIIHTYRAKIILLGDRMTEGSLSAYLASADDPRVISAVGKTTLVQSAALISLSRIFIGNDSALLHIALALKKPSIGIFGSTSSEQVLPSVDFFVSVTAGLDCSPCFIHQPVPDFTCQNDIKCLESITVGDVMRGIQSLLPV
jgi:ADP-heptose:LPS heptosyltransferase